MILLAVFLIVIALAALPFGLSAWRRHRTPPELKDDWWPRFESEFRAYAEKLLSE
jgi:hypothetical protein